MSKISGYRFRTSPFIHVLFYLIFLIYLSCGSAWGVEKLKIDLGTDTAYLPYRFDIRLNNVKKDRTRLLNRSVMTIRPAVLPDQPGLLMRAFNADTSVEDTHRFGEIVYPLWTIPDEDPIPFIIIDWTLYNNKATDRTTIVGAGLSGDTVYAFNLDYENDSISRMVLAVREPERFDRTFVPNLGIVGVNDFDFDGSQEIFIYITVGFSYRKLYCIELETWRMQWTLPMSSTISADATYFSQDPNHPGVMFTTYNPKNGKKDSFFNDRYAYFTFIDTTGYPIIRRILASRHAQMVRACESETPGEYYLSHTIKLVDPETFDGEVSDTVFLSRVDRDGNLLKTVRTNLQPYQMWLQSYGEAGEPHLYITYREGWVAVYDTSLTLVARSDEVKIGVYKGALKITGEPDSVLVFSDGLYNRDLTRLVQFPFPINYYSVAAIDSLGQAVDLVINRTGQYIVGRMGRKTTWELASVFYHRHQAYIMALVSALIVGLVMVSLSRWRARRNLALIGIQKRELEKVHLELREAQAELIAAEKYKQARDIAGGFSHEIRNALFPALAGARSLRKDQSAERLEKTSKRIVRAVSNAIGITQLISKFAKLDEQICLKPVNVARVVNDIIDDQVARIKSDAVEINISGPNETMVATDPDLLRLILTNLVLNSLDAMAGTAERRLEVGWKSKDEYIEIVIADSGEGMTPDRQERIFDAFYSTHPDKGTGIGLTMVRRAIELCGGEIGVESNPGRGTRVAIRIRSFEQYRDYDRTERTSDPEYPSGPNPAG